MRYAFILAPALCLTAAIFAPAAAAKTCSKICNNPAAHVRTAYQTAPRVMARPVYKKADHSHVTIYNSAQHAVSAGRAVKGVRILTPTPLYNPQQQANLADATRRARAAANRQVLAQATARLAQARAAENAARLSAIEAKQDLISERQKQTAQPRRRVYYGNNRFFGRNGFVGNRNFSGGTILTGRKHSGRSKRRAY